MDGMKSVESFIQGASAGQKSGSAVPAMEKKTLKPRIAVSQVEIPSYGTAKGSVFKKATEEPEAIRKSRTPRVSSEEGLTLNEVERAWPQVIELVKAKRMSLSLYLAEAEPAEVEGSVIVLGLPSEFRFHKEMLEKDLNKQVIEDAFEKALNKKVRVQCVVTERDGTTQEAAGDIASAEYEGVPDIVSKALEIFNGSKVIRKD
jgi:DNA polymerase III subunit gamma/tau